jgi:Family of unknown function (DUF6325)
MGPVQALVIGIEHPRFDGQVLSELAKLRESGIVRLLDLLVVRRDDDDEEFETVELPAALGAPDGSIVAAIVGHSSPDTRPADERPEVASWSLADAIPAGSLAAIALIEHLWAGPLVSAIAQSGGTALEETWLAAPDRDALEALLADRDRSGSTTG